MAGMADLSHLTPNRLEQLVLKRQQRVRRRILLIGFPLFLVTIAFSRILALLVLAVVVAYLLTRPRDPVAVAGSQGEQIALAWLKSLPDTFVVFNNVYISSSESRTGFREADLIVCGPSAVFVIEVKHNKGQITCDESLSNWPVYKTGCRGTPYTRSMRNPVRQLKGFVRLLVGHLKARDARVWVQGLVVFTNPEADLYVPCASSVPILRPGDVPDYIVNFPKRGSAAAAQRATQELISLVCNPPVQTKVEGR